MSHEIYHPDWQKNRLRFLFDKLGRDFFAEKRVLELGPYNGFFANELQKAGALVSCVEGRESNASWIRSRYPKVEVSVDNIDRSDWTYGQFDVILNFGVFYHLEKFHREHIKNCLDHCNLLIFESVIFDSFESEICFNTEKGEDQSLSGIGGTPSTSFVENQFLEYGAKFEKISDSFLNGNGHVYDWIDKGSRQYRHSPRRLWLVSK